MLLLLLSRFSCVQLCTTPETAAHQAPPSLGFSRQEHWSGLPFPSPMQESEKWKWSRSVMSDSLQPHGLQLTRLLHPWDFPGKSTGVGCHRLLQNLLYWGVKLPSLGRSGDLFYFKMSAVRVAWPWRKNRVLSGWAVELLCGLLRVFESESVSHLVVSESLWPHER